MNAALLLVVALAPSLTSPQTPVVEGDVTEAHVGGMTILVKHVAGAELATAALYIRGGARNWTKSDAGVEQLALHVAAAGGTKALDKIAFTQKLASLGAFLFADTDNEWSRVLAKGPVTSFDPIFGLLVDVFLRPAMPAAEVELQRQLQIAQIKHQDDDPDGRLGELSDAAIFQGTPYQNRPEGTVDVVDKLTAAQLDQQLDKLRNTARLVLVVVGDVDASQVVARATDAFAKVPHGDYAAKSPAKPVWTAHALTVEERKLPTNYMQGMFVGPSVGSPDYAAGLALRNLLWERLFEEVRTKRNLSYAIGVPAVSTDRVSFVGFYVSAVDPNTTLPVIFHELHRMQTEPLSDADLAAAKALTRTAMVTNQETTDDQATSLARGLLLGGDWRNDQKLRDRIAKLTSADIQAYAKKYFAHFHAVMLGDPKKLDETIAKSF